MKNVGQKAHSAALADMKKEGLILLSELKVLQELPIEQLLESKPKISKTSPDNKVRTNYPGYLV